MKLIGMLDLPFVRRVAISLEVLNVSAAAALPAAKHPALDALSGRIEKTRQFRKYSQVGPGV